MFEAKHRSRNAARFRSSEANNADAAAALRRGDGDDGIVKVHGETPPSHGPPKGKAVFRRLRKGFSQGLGHSGLVVLWIHNHVTAQAFAFALGAQIALVAQSQVDDAALAR
jgi:hypothetical protein